MSISSRTPEGDPSRCPVCGGDTDLEFSQPNGDATCPNCGCLLWKANKVVSKLQRIIAEQLGVDPERVKPDASLIKELGADSLDSVELVMELEEEFDIDIPDVDAERIQTVGDAIRYLLEHERDDEDSEESNEGDESPDDDDEPPPDDE
jgi:acyl carrier protein